MPWWGWLITAVIALVAIYYVVVFVFAAKVFGKATKSIDRIARSPQSDPFDDPFFRDPFGRGVTRKPHDRYL